MLFTVRIHLDPVAALAGHPRGAGLASALREHIGALTRDQLAYKGLLHMRENLMAVLTGLSSPSREEA